MTALFHWRCVRVRLRRFMRLRLLRRRPPPWPPALAAALRLLSNAIAIAIFRALSRALSNASATWRRNGAALSESPNASNIVKNRSSCSLDNKDIILFLICVIVLIGDVCGCDYDALIRDFLFIHNEQVHFRIRFFGNACQFIRWQCDVAAHGVNNVSTFATVIFVTVYHYIHFVGSNNLLAN